MKMKDYTSDGEKVILLHVARKLAPITVDYVEHRRGDVNSVLAALEQGNYDRIRVLGHNMKGTGAAFGLYDITDIGGSIERAAEDHGPEEVRRLVARLRDYVDCVEIVSD